MTDNLHTHCCIVGGGPAGMMLGYLLGRAGIDVIVLEKHADFFRDFRGDTVHPSTLELMHELGLLGDFLKRPHDETKQVSVCVGDENIVMADFSHLPTFCKFLAFMPQWDFLDFLAGEARRYPSFKLMMRAEAFDLIEDMGRVRGVRVRAPEGEISIHAPLVIGADGRHSVIREKAGFKIKDIGAPIDVLWLRLSRRASDPHDSLGRVGAGKMLVMINRGDYWQCAYVIPKGSIDKVKVSGLEPFRQELFTLAPFLVDRVAEIKSWDDVKLLTVAIDRLERWSREGLLCIGDAAHAMSPIGGVGINLAVQDAVATANILVEPLRKEKVTHADLKAVQRRREWPTVMTQVMQVLIQKKVITRVLALRHEPRLPFLLRLVGRLPFLRRILARVIGLGFQPEHIDMSFN